MALMADQDISNGKHYKATLITELDVGQPLDPAFIAEKYTLTPMLFTALKKILRCGDGDKSAEQDIQDVIGALNRELELMRKR